MDPLGPVMKGWNSFSISSRSNANFACQMEGEGRERGEGESQQCSCQVDMVTFAQKTWKNKVKMYKVIGIQCPTLHPN